MTIFGYSRKDYPVSTAEQMVDLLAYNCEKILIEERSFEETKELTLLLSKVQKGDLVVIESLAVLGRSFEGLLNILLYLKNNQVQLISIIEKLDSKKNPDFLKNAQVLYKINSEQRREATKQRLAISREKGQKLGRPKLAEEQITKIRQLSQEQKLTLREIADEIGVSLGSVHKYVKVSNKENKDDNY